MRQSKSKPSVGSRIVKRMQTFTEALERGEGISERFTCRKISLDLQPARYTPEEVKKTRELLKASQAVFAQFLGVSVKTVRSWEQGKEPSPMARRFMDEIRRDPDRFLERLREAVVAK